MSAKTLLDVFEPPHSSMVGHSAALVGMTGAADFLDDAMQRFTRLRPRQRAELGNVLAYLMLDGHSSPLRQEVFPPGRIPGLHEFQPRPVDPGSLLHAKIALLAFAPSRTGAPAHLRLAVLTANYTYTCARQQLELVWVVDVPLDGIARPEDRADLAAAGAFVETLLAQRFYRDKSTLTARLETLLKAAFEVAPANRKPRFIHSFDRPLYDQIRERFRAGTASPRNVLLCGSGFYEQPNRRAAKPEILQKLEDVSRFTKKDVWQVALVEPAEAGAIKHWAANASDDGWSLEAPRDGGRQLHAKFVYAGYRRNGRLSNGWLYLGSGNLTRRGLRSSAKSPLQDGTWNIETGVVFEVPESMDGDTVKRQLFWSIDPKEELDRTQLDVGRVGDAPEDESLLEAPPILSAIIETTPVRHLRLLWRDDATSDAQVSLDGEKWDDATRATDLTLAMELSPVVLHVRIREGSRQWRVPIVDAAGRVGWQPQRFDTYADALAALLDFPIRPAEATDEDDRDDGDMGGTNSLGTREAVEQEKNYALHAAAELVEQVAALQAALPKSMLDDWLDHLDRMFRSSFPEELIATWRTHRLNVFTHLREPELRSPHLTEKQKDRYFKVLDGAARAWGLQ